MDVEGVVGKGTDRDLRESSEYEEFVHIFK